jgi:hypothetical protein
MLNGQAPDVNARILHQFLMDSPFLLYVMLERLNCLLFVHAPPPSEMFCYESTVNRDDGAYCPAARRSDGDEPP